MRPILVRYLLWVLLPVGGAFLAGHVLLQRRAEERRTESAARLGSLGALLLRAEMEAATTDLARRAPVLQDPYPSNSVVEAALRGDTVAALGVDPDGLRLTFALAEPDPETPAGEAPALRVRSLSEPFHPRALPLLRNRAGSPVALYLRGQRVEADPPGFGPERLALPEAAGSIGAPPPTLDTDEGAAVLLPLDPSAPVDSPVQLLVAAPPQRLPGPPRDPGGGFLLLALAAGLASLSLVKRGGSSGTLSPAALLLPPALPVAALWITLLGWGTAAATAAREVQEGEMIRVLALLRESGVEVEDTAIKTGTELDVTRRAPGGDARSTLAPGPARRAVMDLPTPSSTFPATGVLEADGATVAYAALLEEDGAVLVLSAPSGEGAFRGLRLLLGGMAAAATVLALGFVRRTPLLPGPDGLLILKEPEPGPGPDA